MTGLVQPEWARVLADFVAVNTLLFAVLAVGKMLPRVSIRVWRRKARVRRMRAARLARQAPGQHTLPDN